MSRSKSHCACRASAAMFASRQAMTTIWIDTVAFDRVRFRRVNLVIKLRERVQNTRSSASQVRRKKNLGAREPCQRISCFFSKAHVDFILPHFDSIQRPPELVTQQSYLCRCLRTNTTNFTIDKRFVSIDSDLSYISRNPCVSVLPCNAALTLPSPLLAFKRTHYR